MIKNHQQQHLVQHLPPQHLNNNNRSSERGRMPFVRFSSYYYSWPFSCSTKTAAAATTTTIIATTAQEGEEEAQPRFIKTVRRMFLSSVILAALVLLTFINWLSIDSALELVRSSTTTLPTTKNGGTTTSDWIDTTQQSSSYSSYSSSPWQTEKKMDTISHVSSSISEINTTTTTTTNNNSNKVQYNDTREQYTYSQCPFTLSKFSLYQMSLNNDNSHDNHVHMQRAQEALHFSIQHNTYHRVQQALEKEAFYQRTIYLEGDSLTRQLFISLGCLAWKAGHVEYYDLGKVHVITKKRNEILANAKFDGVDKYFSEALIGLRGGGKIYYHPKMGMNSRDKKFVQETRMLVDQACGGGHGGLQKLEVPFRSSIYSKTKIKLGSNDVYVISGGHHSDTRDFLLESYQKALKCIHLGTHHGEEEAGDRLTMNQQEQDQRFQKWPQPWIYQTSSVPMFWTESHLKEEGKRNNPSISATTIFSTTTTTTTDRPLTCRPSVRKQSWRNEDKKLFHNVTWLLGANIPLRKLGRLHVGLGDCLHWIQPGVPDVYAAELADYILATANNVVSV